MLPVVVRKNDGSLVVQRNPITFNPTIKNPITENRLAPLEFDAIISARNNPTLLRYLIKKQNLTPEAIQAIWREVGILKKGGKVLKGQDSLKIPKTKTAKELEEEDIAVDSTYGEDGDYGTIAAENAVNSKVQVLHNQLNPTEETQKEEVDPYSQSNNSVGGTSGKWPGINVPEAFNWSRLAMNMGQINRIADLQRKQVRESLYHLQNPAETYNRIQFIDQNEPQRTADNVRRAQLKGADSMQNLVQSVSTENKLLDYAQRARAERSQNFASQLAMNDEMRRKYAASRAQIANENAAKDAAMRSALAGIDDAEATQKATVLNQRLAEVGQNIKTDYDKLKEADIQRQYADQTSSDTTALDNLYKTA